MREVIFSLCLLSIGGTDVAMAGRASEMIEALSDARRREVLTELLADESCGEVTEIFFKGNNASDNDAAYYAARCSNGSDYLISIQNSGNMATRISSCTSMSLLGINCWDPF